jgi:energy-coupling factor transport system permease protein
MIVDFFRPGTSALHSFDPRAKLPLLLVITVCFFLPIRLGISAAYVALLAVAVGASLGPRELGKAVLAISPLLLVICAFTPLFARGGGLLWAPFGLPYITSAGLLQTARLVIRFTGITLAFFSVFRTIELNDLILALRWYGLSHRMSLVLTITLRFIPTLAQTYVNVRDAHALRKSWGRREKPMERLIPVLTSLVIQAVREIPTLAMVLESRGFGRSNPRTQYAELPGGSRLARHMAAAAVIALACLAPIALPR